MHRRKPMRRNRTLALGAAMLALVISACSPGGGEGTASDGGGTARQPICPRSPSARRASGSRPSWPRSMPRPSREPASPSSASSSSGARDVTHPGLVDGQINLMPEYVGGYLAVTYEAASRPRTSRRRSRSFAGARSRRPRRPRPDARHRCGRLRRPAGDRRRARSGDPLRPRRGGRRPTLGRGAGVRREPELRPRPGARSTASTSRAWTSRTLGALRPRSPRR